jgi:hypothetical protein
MWVTVLEQSLAVTEQDRDDVQLKLIDQPGSEILLYQVGASCKQHIAPARGLLCLLECRLDSIGDEDEGGASLHRQGLAGMVGEHEDRRGVWKGGLSPHQPFQGGSWRHGPGPPSRLRCWRDGHSG